MARKGRTGSIPVSCTITKTAELPAARSDRDVRIGGRHCFVAGDGRSGPDQQMIEDDRLIGGKSLNRFDIPLQSDSFLATHVDDFNGDPVILNLPDFR